VVASRKSRRSMESLEALVSDMGTFFTEKR
jgi:hypothetical protein